MQKRGFTLVELLIVIVVIAILAAITLVAYNGITSRASGAAAQASVTQVSQKIQAYNVDHNAYPSSLADIGVANTNTITYTYKNYTTDYCIAATTSAAAYQIEAGSPPVVGNCVDIMVSVYNGSGTNFVTYSGAPLQQATYTAPIDYWWSTGGPLPTSPVDHFVAIFTGYITPPVTDTYTFTSDADDRAFLYLNGALVVDGSGVGSSTDVSGTASLTAGQRIPFSYVVGENSGQSGGRLFWSYTGQAQTIIPASAFSG